MMRINTISNRGVKMLQRRNQRAAARYQEQLQAQFAAHMAEHLHAEIEQVLGDPDRG